MENLFVTPAAHSTVFSAVMRKVYVWMTLGLIITAMAAYYTADSGLVYKLGSSVWLLGLGELGIVLGLTAGVRRMSFPTAAILFALFSILNGVTLSGIFLIYTMSSISTTFFVTAGTFGAMSLIGYTTKKDLSFMHRILFMALIGLIIATIVNIFVANSMLDWIITYAGVIIFSGLTAYDTQKIKTFAANVDNPQSPMVQKLGIICALTLYLDFINLFLYLLRIFGNRD